ncbi:MAG TPA: hypothetical protein VD763_02640 [Candidatus Saccharimonadales bacterium]|nr:hypothetical protein [Candidatus Saccharimonadales bacterium]
MSTARTLVAIVVAALSVITIGVSPTAAAKATTSYHLEAYSNNCQFEGETDCVNITISIDFASGGGAGTFCVSTQDNRVGGPPVATGCVTSTGIGLRKGSIVVPRITVPSVLAPACHPGDDGCVEQWVDVTASATFQKTGRGEAYTTIDKVTAGQCETSTVTSGVRTAVSGTVTVNGTVYALPGTDPTAHHRAATLVEESVRVRTRCR